MKRFLFQFLFVALPFAAASFLQTVEIGPIKGLQNLFWGSVFGVGWFVAGKAMTESVANLIGFFIWPLFLSLLFYKWAGFAWNSNRRALHAAVLFLSLFVLVTYKTAIEPPFDRLPLFFPMLNTAF